MSKPDYTAFDAELLRLIAAGKNKMMLLDSRKENGLLFELAKPHCMTDRSRWGVDPWRIIDRRLQALRKKGKIAFSRNGWEVVTKGGAS